MRANISTVQLLACIVFLLALSALFFIYKYMSVVNPDVIDQLIKF
ncbi:hypothetical protein [Sphingobacterium bovistauri]|nr:hypothetical protein [Sphingobacterium bovistauri]